MMLVGILQMNLVTTSLHRVESNLDEVIRELVSISGGGMSSMTSCVAGNRGPGECCSIDPLASKWLSRRKRLVAFAMGWIFCCSYHPIHSALGLCILAERGLVLRLRVKCISEVADRHLSHD
mmetsp:Transcript_10276/g.20720  ORF Transcript_10276/g.20720 Transcript_10276/m.20720 type:complete len:122 (+) Transcript_10276:287-652(+)